MELIDFNIRYRRNPAAIEARIHAVGEHDHFIMGPETQALESVPMI